jgi:hypothetical protein
MKVSRAPVLLSVAILSVGLIFAESDEVPRSRIKRVPVESTNVASIGYSRHLHALEIEFTRGAIYRFLDVPIGIYRDLIAAKSKGHFIAEKIRGRYRFLRVRPGRKELSATHNSQDVEAR